MKTIGRRSSLATFAITTIPILPTIPIRPTIPTLQTITMLQAIPITPTPTHKAIPTQKRPQSLSDDDLTKCLALCECRLEGERDAKMGNAIPKWGRV